jgi:hypothetical protein
LSETDSDDQARFISRNPQTQNRSEKSIMKESATTSEGIPRSETLIGKSVIKSEEVLNIEDKQDGNDNKIKMGYF